MRTSKLKCDRCGSLSSTFLPSIEEDDGAIAGWESFELDDPYRQIDLCPHCTMALNQWLSSLKREESNVITM